MRGLLSDGICEAGMKCWLCYGTSIVPVRAVTEPGVRLLDRPKAPGRALALWNRRNLLICHILRGEMSHPRVHHTATSTNHQTLVQLWRSEGMNRRGPSTRATFTRSRLAGEQVRSWACLEHAIYIRPTPTRPYLVPLSAANHLPRSTIVDFASTTGRSEAL